MQANRSSDNLEKKTRWGLLGAIVGAVAASICCVGPLVLLAIGIGGAWVSQLTILEPYRPIFIGFTLLLLGYTFYRVYRKPAVEECEDGSYCANPNSDRINKITLWVVTILVLGLMAFPYVVPVNSQASAVSVPIKTAKAILEVEGMTCNGCVLTVNGSLKKIPGVVDTRVTLKPPRAIVEYDPTQVLPEVFVSATTRAGYPSRIITIEGAPNGK